MGPVLEILVALAIVAGLFGIVIPILPGLLLELAAVLVWATIRGGGAWVVAAVCLLIAIAGTVVKYLIPGRRLKESGLPTLALVAAIAAAIAGLFVIPVVGAPLGFVATIYVIERIRVGPQAAWPSTKTAMGAVALSIGVELTAGLLLAAVWFGVVIVG